MKNLKPFRLVFLSFFLLSFQNTLVYSQAEAPLLVLSQSVEREIKGGETHQFRIQLAQNQTARIEIEQKGVVYWLSGLKPTGEKYLEIIVDSGFSKNNFILITSEAGGEYKLEVEPNNKNLKPAKYQIKLTEVRALTDEDKKINEAAGQITKLLMTLPALAPLQTEAANRKLIETHHQLIDQGIIIKDKYLQAQCWLQLNFVHRRLSEYQKAVEAGGEALKIWRELGNKAQQAVALNSIGVAYRNAQNNPLALENFQEALKIALEIKSINIEGFVMSNMAIVYDIQGESQKAIDCYLRTVEIQKILKDPGDEARMLGSLGLAYYRISENEKALEAYNRALMLAREVNDKGAEAALMHNFGLLYNRMGESRKAIEYYSKALEINQTSGDKRGQAANNSSIGFMHETLGEYEKALEFFERSLKLYRELGTRGEGPVLNNMGALLDNLGDKERALDLFNQSLAIRREIGDKRGEANLLANLGGMYEDSGELMKARANYEQALNLWRSFRDRENEAKGLAFLGNIARLEKNLAQAAELYTQSLDLARTVSSKSTEAASLSNLALIYDLQGDKPKALEFIAKANEIQTLLENRRLKALNLYHQARIEKDLNKLTEARRDIESAIVLVEKLRGKIPTQSLRTSYFATVQQFYDLYIQILINQHEAEPTRGADRLAFETSERARARSLLELLQEARVDVRAGADAALLTREKELEELISLKAIQRTQLLSGKFTPEQKEKANSEINSLTGELENLRSRLRRDSPRFASLTQSLTLSVREIQNLLDDKTVLLEYKLGETRSFLWLVTKNDFKLYSLPAGREIEAVAKSYYDAVVLHNRADDAKMTELAKKLSDILLAPVASEFGGRRLAIVADGVIQYIPFSALVEKNEVVSLPSASVLAELRQKSTAKASTAEAVAIFADAVFEVNDPRLATASKNNGLPEKSPAFGKVLRDFNLDENLPRLLSSREEARHIMSFMPKTQAVLNVDFDASRENATSENLADYRILHFATHGFLDTLRPELSGLVFSLYDKDGKKRDGFLRLAQIYNLKLNSDLVVLSACQTALGRDVRGEGLIGLTRGFMYAGARRIVASLWKVDDAATAEFMKHFYQNLLQKKLSPVAALRAAQNEMKQIPRFKPPYFWAGFIIQGDWQSDFGF